MEKALKISPIRIKEVGRVKEVKKTIARVTGLSLFMNGQLVEFGSGVKGMIVGFTERDILVLILGDETQVRIGAEVYSKNEEFKIPVGEGFIGRIVSALGEPVDGKGPVVSGLAGERVNRSIGKQTNRQTEYYPVFRESPETMNRGSVDSCLETGIKIIDAIAPIAKGQRQLIIGDRMTGKTTIAVDAVLNQKGKAVICIYCCIGKSFSSLLKVVQLFKLKRALDYTIVIASCASTTVGEQYLAPYSASALGEYFMYNGKDVLVVFDDMTKHAWSYRQISLLLERPPGREAYPGDIYYIHSQLIERAGKLSKELSGGSMTFFPIVDTLQGDVTGFIPSNLVSMTDGQVYLSSSLFAEGFKPAVDMPMTVSIIGTRIENPILKRLTGVIRLEYMQYKELLRLTKLKADLSEEAACKIRRGEALCAILTQGKNSPVSIEELIVLLYAFNRKILDELDTTKVNRFKNEIWGYITEKKPGLVQKLQLAKELNPEIRGELDKIFVEFFKEIEG